MEEGMGRNDGTERERRKEERTRRGERMFFLPVARKRSNSFQSRAARRRDKRRPIGPRCAESALEHY
eukprot:657378-Pyramimonas_sp.AAC.1